MVSLKKLVFCMGNNENKPVTIKHMKAWFTDEKIGDDRINTFLRRYFEIFRKHPIKGRSFRFAYTLTNNGLKYYEKLSHQYDPTTDSFLDVRLNDNLDVERKIDKEIHRVEKNE